MVTKIINRKTLQYAGVAGFYSLLFAIPLIAAAWSTSQSANAVCTQSGTANVDVRFTNTESDTNHAMNVVAKDLQTQHQVDLGRVNPHETKTGTIVTDKTSLGNGTVEFDLTWTNKSGSDKRTANYSGVNCNPPTPTPKPKPTNTPTPTPHPTATPMPTATPTPHPTATPMPTATPTPQPSETPVPTVQPTETPVPTVTPVVVATNTNQTQNNNTNNNTNTNNNNPVINVTQNVEQHTGDVNVTQNVQPAVVESTTETVTETPTPTPLQVQETPAAKQLPGTGAETSVLLELISLAPLGWKLRKLAKI